MTQALEKESVVLLENKPTPYVITVEEFQRQPTEILPYKMGDRVTRENFAGFIIDSFRKSRGFSYKHVEYLEWISFNTGINIPNTLDNLRKAGGLKKIMSDEETEAINGAFRKAKTPGHFLVEDPRNQLELIDEQLGYQDGYLLIGYHKCPEDVLRLPKDQFLTRLKEDRW